MPSATKARARAPETSPAPFLDRPRGPPATQAPARPPLREHTLGYHRPLLLDQPTVAEELLRWFTVQEHAREMPWRQAWIDPEADDHQGSEERAAKRTKTEDGASPDGTPKEDLRSRLKRRAYEVWISEIMLQQTRVETVREYWLAWMRRWPTIEALAEASPDDVLAAWRGLGYYSRATRIHQAAKQVVEHPELQGLLPENVDALQELVPGVGRYTAGAISSIVFGHAVPILDGNVGRVLSRQSALYADPKAKQTTDVLWAMAQKLVERVSAHAAERSSGKKRSATQSATPGAWNQALMELGSTLCTAAKPDCAACPIRETCLAYAEGLSPASEEPTEIEDLCTLCAPLPEDTEDAQGNRKKADSGPARGGKMKQTTLFGAPPEPKGKPAGDGDEVERGAKHARLFPMKASKTAARIEERVVCIVRATTDDSADPERFLVVQRPAKGLLAGLWEFPACVLEDHAAAPGTTELEERARAFVSTLALPPLDTKPVAIAQVDSARHLGYIKHMFSHLHWSMRVVLVNVSLCVPASDASAPERPARWLTATGVHAETMGTGLRRCWELLRKQRT